MKRREFLKTGSVISLCCFAGCIASQNDPSNGSDKNQNQSDSQKNQNGDEEKKLSSGIWPGQRVDAANTGHHPNAQGPTKGVKKDLLLENGGEIHCISDGNIYFEGEDGIYSVETTGENKRKLANPEMHQPEMTVDEDTLYVAGGTPSVNDKVIALNKKDGSEKWRFVPKEETEFEKKFGGQFSVDAPIEVKDNKLFLGAEASKDYDTVAGFIYAVDTQNGEKVWEHRKKGIPARAPSVADGKVYFSMIERESFYCLDSSSGEQIWSFTPDEPLEGGLPYTTGAVNGYVYVVASSGYLYALNPEDGSEEWKRNLSCDSEMYPPATDGESVYVSTGDRLVSLDGETGDEDWSVEGAFEEPVVAGGAVYVSGRDMVLSQTEEYDVLRGAMVYAFDASTGDGFWNFQTRWEKGREEVQRGVYAVVVVDREVYVSTELFDIYALGEGSKGYEKHEFPKDMEDDC